MLHRQNNDLVLSFIPVQHSSLKSNILKDYVFSLFTLNGSIPFVFHKAYTQVHTKKYTTISHLLLFRDTRPALPTIQHTVTFTFYGSYTTVYGLVT